MLVGSLLLGTGLKVRLSALPCGVSWDQCVGLGNAEHLLGKLAGVKAQLVMLGHGGTYLNCRQVPLVTSTRLKKRSHPRHPPVRGCAEKEGGGVRAAAKVASPMRK